MCYFTRTIVIANMPKGRSNRSNRSWQHAYRSMSTRPHLKSVLDSGNGLFSYELRYHGSCTCVGDRKRGRGGGRVLLYGKSEGSPILSSWGREASDLIHTLTSIRARAAGKKWISRHPLGLESMRVIVPPDRENSALGSSAFHHLDYVRSHKKNDSG